jgi:sugar phosphate isomerase/epimerase
MVTYGKPGVELDDELALAERIGARLLEILPSWSALPDPAALRARALARGFLIHSAHGCWGRRSIRAERVDLGSTHQDEHRESVDDLKRCIDWLAGAGGKCLVVHPGGLSAPEQSEQRREALARGLVTLGEHARGSDVVVCVENMPPGVNPGARMADLANLLAQLDHPQLALALDTGHANLSSGADRETLIAGTRLATTHVHDNDGERDTHLPPGKGTVNWHKWRNALDQIDYAGPIILECIRHLREHFEDLDREALAILLQNGE